MTMDEALSAFEAIRESTRTGEAANGIATLAVQQIRAKSPSATPEGHDSLCGSECDIDSPGVTWWKLGRRYCSKACYYGRRATPEGGGPRAAVINARRQVHQWALHGLIKPCVADETTSDHEHEGFCNTMTYDLAVCDERRDAEHAEAHRTLLTPAEMDATKAYWAALESALAEAAALLWRARPPINTPKKERAEWRARCKRLFCDDCYGIKRVAYIQESARIVDCRRCFGTGLALPIGPDGRSVP